MFVYSLKSTRKRGNDQTEQGKRSSGELVDMKPPDCNQYLPTSGEQFLLPPPPPPPPFHRVLEPLYVAQDQPNFAAPLANSTPHIPTATAAAIYSSPLMVRRSSAGSKVQAARGTGDGIEEQIGGQASKNSVRFVKYCPKHGRVLIDTEGRTIAAESIS